MSLLVCPNCNVSMQPIKRVDVELDICPQCRGVWLDRGELEKLLDQERARLNEEIGRAPRPDDAGRPDSRRWSEHDDDHDDHHGHGGYRKKRSFFDIFD